MKNFLKTLIDRFAPTIFKPVPEGLMYVLLQAFSREISGECPWDTSDNCYLGYTTYWYRKCRNILCPGYRHPLGLIAYTSRSDSLSSVDNRFDFSSFRSLTLDDYIPIGTLGVEAQFGFSTFSNPGGFGVGYYGVGYFGDNSTVVSGVDIQIGDKWYIDCVAVTGVVGPARPSASNRGSYGPTGTSGPYTGSHDTTYTIEIIDFWAYMQNFQDALLQISLATCTDEWIDFWGEYFGMARLYLGTQGYESDSSYKSRIMKEITRAKGTKPVLLEEAKAYFGSDAVSIKEYNQYPKAGHLWDGLNPGQTEAGAADPDVAGLMPFEFYIYLPSQRTPSCKFVKTGANLMASGLGKVYSYEGGYGYLYPYGTSYPLPHIGVIDGIGDNMFSVPTNVGDACLVSSTTKFCGTRIVFITPGVGGTYVWEYWNGIGWTTLTVSDTTLGLTQNGYIYWEVPGIAWEKADNIPYNIPNIGERRYWVRVRVVVAPTTTPIADYIPIIYAGQTCRGNYTGTQYLTLSNAQTISSVVGFTPFYAHQPLSPATPVLSIYDPTKRDLNNCYIYLLGSFERPLWESGLQDIINRLKTAGTIAIINPRII